MRFAVATRICNFRAVVSQSFESLLAACEDLVRRGKHHAALEGLADLEKERPDHAHIQYLKAEAMRHTGGAHEAKLINDRLLERGPDKLHLWRQRGWLMTQSEGLSATVEATIKLIEENAPQGIVDTYMRIVARFDPGFVACSENYRRGRIFLLGGRLEKAREFLAAAGEKDAAAFDLSVIDFLLTGVPIDISHYSRDVHSRHELTIWTNAMEAQGRRDEALAFLNSLKALETNGMAVKRPALLATMQKSGTGFYFAALRRIVSAGTAPVTQGVGSDALIVGPWLDAAIAGGFIPTGHCSAALHNQTEILSRALPVFLSVRDPRDAAWSWFRYMEEQLPLEKIALSYLPRNYCDLPYEERLVAMYRQYFPYLVQWLRDWKSFLENFPDHPVLVSRYEDFTKDNAKTIRSLLSLCGANVPEEQVNATVAQMREQGAGSGAFHFRKGRAGSWREALNDQIAGVIDGHWDEEVLHYFDYQK